MPTRQLTISGNLVLENLTNPESGFLKSENQWPNPQIQIAENMGRYSAHLPPLVEVWKDEFFHLKCRNLIILKRH